jgi:hypothetical protein
VKIQLEQAEESPTNNDVNLGAADESPTNNDNVNLDAEQPPTSLSTQKSRRDDTFHFHGPRSVRHWIHQRRHRTNDDPIRSYVKGKVIDRQHELFIMSIAIMLGMRTSIGKTNRQMAETSHDERRWLDNDDLMAVEKYVFPPRVSRSDFCFEKGQSNTAHTWFLLLFACRNIYVGIRYHSPTSAATHFQVQGLLTSCFCLFEKNVWSQ